MLNAMRDNHIFALIDNLVTVPEFHHQLAFVYHEQPVFDFVMVPHKLTFEFGQFDHHVVDLTSNARAPRIRKLGK